MSETLLERASPETAPYRAEFEKRRAATAREPRWLLERRERAMGAFAEAGFPNTRQEAWRFTSVAAIARASFAFPPAPPVRVTAPEGVRVLGLGEALQREPELLERQLGRQCPGRTFDALNTALFEDAVVVLVSPEAAVEAPIELRYEAPAGAAGHPRVLVVCARGSQSALVERFGGEDGSLTAAVTEVVLEDGAQLQHYRLQTAGDGAFHVGLAAVEQGRDSRYAAFSVSLGAALSRLDLEQRFAAPGGECVLDGLLLASGRQHSDLHTRIDHAVPHCASRELVKGVFDGEARGVFHGTIVVRKDAQKTDAWQVNKNLLLSRRALVTSTPALEILADDVKCKHGSTTGQLDPLSLFYLRSRGLGEREARGLLVHGFVAELLARVGPAALRAELEERVGSWLPAALGPAGEVRA
ncbi:MAG TPA: Fe-S cluster assembly protein SufD [Vicinamibacteria bacterium]|jgi:Fe-S cluster assembly protein SufD